MSCELLKRLPKWPEAVTSGVVVACWQGLQVSDREDPFAAIIRCTAGPAKADKRTRSKWSRVMRYVAVYKPGSEAAVRFIRRKGGINACAARFSRWMGRHTTLRRCSPEW
jgi:hypothetical protein